MHIPTPDQVRQLLASSQAQTLSADARTRLKWIAHFVQSDDSIGVTCRKFHIARGTLLLWLERFDPNDLANLEEHPRSFASRGSAVPEETASLIRGYRQREPLMGKTRIRELLLLEHGMNFSSSTIGRVIERDCLYFGDTPLHWRKRMRRQTSAAQTVVDADKVRRRRRAAVFALTAFVLAISVLLGYAGSERMRANIHATSTNDTTFSLDPSPDGR